MTGVKVDVVIDITTGVVASVVLGVVAGVVLGVVTAVVLGVVTGFVWVLSRILSQFLSRVLFLTMHIKRTCFGTNFRSVIATLEPSCLYFHQQRAEKDCVQLWMVCYQTWGSGLE